MSKINISALPPPETNTVKLWRLNTTVYGLCDAPSAWYQKLKTELINVGTSQSIYDNALFFWRRDNKLKGLLCCHVNDCFFAGSVCFMTP